jgi:hypothetical protein
MPPRTKRAFNIGSRASFSDHWACSTPKRAVSRYSSRNPRRRPIVTAWVRSLAPSLDRMLRTCPFTVSSLICRRSATTLLEHPPAICLSTSISRSLVASRNLFREDPDRERGVREVQARWAELRKALGG